MKTLFTFISILLIAKSITVHAEDNLKNKREKNKTVAAVPIALFVWGDPDAPAPEELKFLKAKNAMVPLTPSVCGSPDEIGY